MNNLYLIGMRGVGKTTIGQILAQELGKEFVDMDKKIEQALSEHITDWVEKNGWGAFRERERTVLNEVSKLDNRVISTGGGVLMYFDNADRLKDTGKLIHLTASIQTIRKRLAQSDDRPSLTGNGFLEELEQVWNERKDRYDHFADQVVSTDGRSLEEIVQEIMQEL